MSPIGCYQIVAILYRPDRLRLKAPDHFRQPRRHQIDWQSNRNPKTDAATSRLRMIGPGDIWSDDPNDPAYNRLIAAPNGRDHGFTHEDLRRADPVYDVVCVLDFNLDEPKPGRGSAIFLHVWRAPRHPTAGCIAFSRTNLLDIIANWTPRSRVFVQ